MSWVIRIQNETNYQNQNLDLSLSDVTTLFLPGNKTSVLEQTPIVLPTQQSQVSQASASSLEVSVNNISRF